MKTSFRLLGVDGNLDGWGVIYDETKESLRRYSDCTHRNTEKPNKASRQTHISSKSLLCSSEILDNGQCIIVYSYNSFLLTLTLAYLRLMFGITKLLCQES